MVPSLKIRWLSQNKYFWSNLKLYRPVQKIGIILEFMQATAYPWHYQNEGPWRPLIRGVMFMQQYVQVTVCSHNSTMVYSCNSTFIQQYVHATLCSCNSTFKLCHERATVCSCNIMCMQQYIHATVCNSTFQYKFQFFRLKLTFHNFSSFRLQHSCFQDCLRAGHRRASRDAFL